MGKAMDKKNVIYGEQKSQPLAGWNKWTEAAAAVTARVGEKEAVSWNVAKEAVKKAQANPKMKEAYIKIGAIGADLIFRVKEKKWTGDIEEDALLLRGFPDKAAAHEKAEAALTPLDRGRAIVLDDLKAAKDRKEAWAALRTLGAKQADLDQLDTADDLFALTKRLDIDAKYISHPSDWRSDRGLALGMIEVVSEPAKVTALLGVIGVPRAKVESLARGYSPAAFEADVHAAGVGPVVAKKVAALLVNATDSGRAHQALKAASKPGDILKLLETIGVPRQRVDALSGGYSSAEFARDLQAEGVDAATATRLADILVDIEAPSDKARRKLAAATDRASAVKELAKLGIPVKTIQGWLSGGSEEAVVDAVAAKGVDAKEAARVAGLILP